jgi:hypothetical protein
VLGVSASGRDAGCGGENWEMALLINREICELRELILTKNFDTNFAN